MLENLLNFTENMQFKLKNIAGRVTSSPAKLKIQSRKRIHEGVKCDHCKACDFEGDRFCCTVCDKYNLCSECFCSGDINKNHMYNHPCIQITYPLEASACNDVLKLDDLVETYKEKDFNVNCSICGHKIKGVYLKCNKCYNKHYCFECWRDKRHNVEHTCLIFKSYKLEYFEKSELKMVRPLGNGNFGFVYQALLKPYDCYVACKFINKNINLRLHLKNNTRQEYDRFQSIDKELEAYIEIVSPYICKLLGYGGRKPSKMFLVMEYMENGSLEDLVQNESESPVTLLEKFRIMYNIAFGLADIHDKNFIHADVKPKNILLNSDLTAKLCDLGSTKNLNNRIITNKQIGGLYYLPYEFYLGKYDNKVDVYSFGLVMYHLMSGSRHSYNPSGMLVLDKLHQIPNNFVKALIWKSTQFNAIKRGMIHYYKDILKIFLKTITQVFDKFEFTQFYEILTHQQKNIAILYLNDSIIELIEKELQIKLAYDSFNIDVEQLGIHEEIKTKMDTMILSIREKSNSIHTNVKITELIEEDDE